MRMARTDDDSWDVTESVGATALGVAMARADEAASECPLFTDPYAQLFIDAATARGWTPPFDDATLAELGKDDPQLAQRMAVMWGYAASRTKWFDEFFIAAGAAGVLQAVILAAGLDARAWRLPWVSETVVYEIDQPKVVEAKSATMARIGATPTCGRSTVAADLRPVRVHGDGQQPGSALLHHLAGADDPVPGQHPGRTDARVPGERQLADRGEDAQPVVRTCSRRGQRERRLGQPELRRDALHLPAGQLRTAVHHGQRVPGVRAIGEDVDDVVAQAHRLIVITRAVSVAGHA